MFSKIMKAMSLAVIEKITRLTIGLFVNIKIAELMGLRDFGYYSMIVALTALCLSVSFIGFDNRLLSSNSSDSTLGRIFGYALIRGVIFVIFSVLIIATSSNDILSYVVYLPVLSVFAMMVVSEQIAVLFNQYQVFVFIRLVLYAIIVLPLRMLGLIGEEAMPYFIALAMLDLFLPAVIYSSFLAVRFVGSKQHKMISSVLTLRHQVGGILVADYKYFLIGLLLVVSFRLDYLIGAKFLSSEELGKYAFTMMFITPFTSFGKTITYMLRSFFPDLVKSGRVIFVALLGGPLLLFGAIAGIAFFQLDKINEIFPLFEAEMLLAVFLVPLAWYALFSNQQMSANGSYSHLFVKSLASLVICSVYYVNTDVEFSFLYFVFGLYLFYAIQGILYDLFVLNRVFSS